MNSSAAETPGYLASMALMNASNQAFPSRQEIGLALEKKTYRHRRQRFSNLWHSLITPVETHSKLDASTFIVAIDISVLLLG